MVLKSLPISSALRVSCSAGPPRAAPPPAGGALGVVPVESVVAPLSWPTGPPASVWVNAPAAAFGPWPLPALPETGPRPPGKAWGRFDQGVDDSVAKRPRHNSVHLLTAAASGAAARKCFREILTGGDGRLTASNCTVIPMAARNPSL